MNRSRITLAVCLAALIAGACSSGPETQSTVNSNSSGTVASAGSSNSNAPAAQPAAAPAAPAPPAAPANANASVADTKPPAPAGDQKKEDAKSAAAKPAPVAADGAALWAANKCSFCHGADGKGNPKMKGVPDFTDAAWQKKEGDGELAAVIKNGKKPMPPFGATLSENEIKALVGYVRGFARK